MAEQTGIPTTMLFLGPFKILLGYAIFSLEQSSKWGVAVNMAPTEVIQYMKRYLQHALPYPTSFSTSMYLILPFPQLDGESVLSANLMFMKNH